MQKAKLPAIRNNAGRNVVPFTKDLALRFLQNAYPDAEITISTEHKRTRYRKESNYSVIVIGPGPEVLRMGISQKSLKDAFKKLFDREFERTRIDLRTGEVRIRPK
jgi:hypothetical protein